MWQAKEVCNGYVTWTCDFCGCRRRPPARTFESLGWVSQRSRNGSVMQFCNKSITLFLSLCQRSCLAFKFCKQTMSHDPDSENVNRLWSDRPNSSGDANIFRCVWCFTLLMKLHDFVTEFFNPEHIFSDAHTVSFCLTTDHISTCLMMFSARWKTAQFWSVLDMW